MLLQEVVEVANDSRKIKGYTSIHRKNSLARLINPVFKANRTFISVRNKKNKRIENHVRLEKQHKGDLKVLETVAKANVRLLQRDHKEKKEQRRLLFLSYNS